MLKIILKNNIWQIENILFNGLDIFQKTVIKSRNFLLSIQEQMH